MPNRFPVYLAVILSLAVVGCSQEEPPAPYSVIEVSLSQISADLASGKNNIG